MAPGRAQLVPTCGRQRPTWRQRITLTASRVTPRPPPAIGPPRLPTARPAPPGAARSHTASDGGGYHRAPNPRSPLRLSAARSGKEGTHFRFRDASSSPALRNAIRRGRRDKKHRGERGAALRCAALSWLVLCPAGTADLGGGCRYVVDRRDAVAPRSVLAERAPALRSRPASWFPIHSPAALSPLCTPGAACNAASWPQE